ncbi:hypothetical protein JXA12_00270, partial [Candidatus Woesearchaeota archaeon]|nr:hypothetical protein [Candidatus Woesearchaeota archaeon]
YATVVILICAAIYAKTKEVYRLSGYEGIRFFRHTFLFFALAFLFRLIPLLFRVTDLHVPGLRLGFLTGFYLFGYASSMAVISLARSATWKKLRRGVMSKPYLYHALALLLPGVVFLTRSRLVFFLTQAGLIISVFIITVAYHRRRKKQSFTRLTYLLLLLFWLVNLAIVTVPKFMTVTIYALYALSLAVFAVILCKVLRKVRG